MSLIFCPFSPTGGAGYVTKRSCATKSSYCCFWTKSGTVDWMNTNFFFLHIIFYLSIYANACSVLSIWFVGIVFHKCYNLLTSIAKKLLFMKALEGIQSMMGTTGNTFNLFTKSNIIALCLYFCSQIILKFRAFEYFFRLIFLSGGKIFFC